MSILGRTFGANQGKSGLVIATLRADDDGCWGLDGVYGEKTSENMIPKEQSDWESERSSIIDDIDLCPCDGHPAPENCETCRGACSCHWIDRDAEWFRRDWESCGTDMLESRVARKSLSLDSMETAAGMVVRLYGRMWWRRYYDGECDGGFSIEKWEEVKP